MTSRKKAYDICVIGGGLSGWIVAKSLAERTLARVALLEASPQIGGWLRPQGLKTLPAGEETLHSLNFLAELLGTPISYGIHTEVPVTFEKGELLPFVGFGEKAPDEVDELSYYLSHPRWMPESPEVHDWIPLLAKSPKFDVFLKTEVTRLLTEEGSVKWAQVNGEKTLEATHFIFTGPMKDLLKLLPQNEIPPKVAAKVSRTEEWTALALDLVHSAPITDSRAIHLLQGTGESARPILGYFHPANSNHDQAPTQLSQWLGFLSEEDEGEETQAMALREMKRQIKRAFPQAMDSLSSERILVAPRSHRHLNWKDEKGLNLLGISNLYASSPEISGNRNILGAIDRAKVLVDYFVEKLGSISPITSSPVLDGPNEAHAPIDL